jgi:SAM-dependent methyltransferase
MFYASQVRRFTEALRPGAVVVDIGCGPTPPYKRDSDFFLIGVDASFESVRANKALDIPVYASSEALPLPDHSVDLLVCFYSIHHMTGETLVENMLKVTNAFREFSRVIKPGGAILIFDLSPWWPGAVLGNAVWNVARRTMGKTLDMYFWRESSLRALGRNFFERASFRLETFHRPLFSTFPPIFSRPSFKIPRLLYPFDVNLYRWDFPLDSQEKR